MRPFGKHRAALLAAVSVVAASAAVTPANASSFDDAAYPAIVSVEAPQAATHVDDQTAVQKPSGATGWALFAAGAGLLAGIVKLVGARKIATAVVDGSVRTAKAAKTAATSAVRVVGRAASSPLRFLTLIGGLLLFAIAGIGFYDLEWIVGLITGAALAGAGLYAMWKMRLILRPARAKAVQAKHGE